MRCTSKKLAVTVVLAGIMLCMAACGKKDAVKDDLYSYLTEMAEVQELQKTAINEYNNCVGSPEADSQQLLAALNDSIIPTYEEYITKLNAVAPETEEVQSVKAACVDGANKQMDALNKVKEAIEACDTDMLSEADALISEAEGLFDAYETQLEALASEHEITLVNQGSGGAADTTDAADISSEETEAE